MKGPSNTTELAYPEYWNARYGSQLHIGENSPDQALESYDWFGTFDKIHPFLLKCLPPASSGIRILHLGCGNSVSTLKLFLSPESKQHWLTRVLTDLNIGLA